MKQIFTIFAMGATLFFVAGCSSYDPFEDLSLIDPMGIVRVSSNTEIDWYGESESNKIGNGLLGAVANVVINESKNEDVSNLLARTDLLVNQAEAVLRSSLEEVGTVTISGKEDVLNSRAYDRADDTLAFTNTALLRADGYKYFEPSDEKGLAVRLRDELGIKCVLYADFTFEKVMDSGVEKNGMMGVGVEMWVQMFDETGKRIYANGYWEQSEDTIPVVAGLYNPDDMMDLYSPVIESVCRDFALQFRR